MLVLVALTLADATVPSRQFTTCLSRAGGVSAAMLTCGAAEIAQVDRRLNATYRQLLAALPPSQRSALRAEQRGWLRHHLAETRRLADDPNDGSMAFIESQRFELQDLGDRTAVLEARLARLG